jgi:hypothetical protein
MFSGIVETETDRLRVEAHDLRNRAEEAHRAGNHTLRNILLLQAAARYEAINLSGFASWCRRWARVGA